MNKKIKKEYWMVVLAGCGLIGTALGMGVNLAGLFFTAIASDLGIGRGTVALNLTIYNLVMAFTGMIAPRYVRRFGIKKMVLFGTILQVGATFLLSLCPNVGYLYALNVLRGFSAGLIGMVTVTIMINYWFSKNNALMTSICMGFSGLVSALLSTTISSVISTGGWRKGYVVVALLSAIFNLPALLLPIALKPQMKQLLPFGDDGIIPEARAAEKQESSSRESRKEQTKTIEAAKSSVPPIAILPFFLMLVYAFFNSGVSSLSQHFTGISESYGVATTGALMVSACMVTNTGGKVLLGALIDRFGARRSISVFSCCVVAAGLVLAFTRNSTVMITAAAFYGLAYAVATVALAMLTREIFGSANYSRVYPKMTLASSLGTASFTPIAGFIFDLTGSYTPVILLLAGLAAASFALMHTVYILHQGRF